MSVSQTKTVNMIGYVVVMDVEYTCSDAVAACEVTSVIDQYVDFTYVCM